MTKSITNTELRQLIQDVLLNAPGSPADARRAIHDALNGRDAVANANRQ